MSSSVGPIDARSSPLVPCVVDWSPTQYARSGDLHVAYQVLGEGEVDVLILPYGLNISIDAHDEEPHWNRFVRRFGSGSSGSTSRVGVHTGEIERRGDDIGGDHGPHRLAGAGRSGAGHRALSRVVTDLVGGSGLRFTPRGDFELKGVPGPWPLFTAGL